MAWLAKDWICNNVSAALDQARVAALFTSRVRVGATALLLYPLPSGKRGAPGHPIVLNK
jgi:hypothetical protein